MPETIALSSKIQINADVFFQDLRGEGVLLNSKTGVYFGLDHVGCRVWQLLRDHEALPDVLPILLEEYDVSEETLTKEVLLLMTEMMHHGLVTVSGYEGSGA